MPAHPPYGSRAAKSRIGGLTSRPCGPVSTTLYMAFAWYPIEALIAVMRRQLWMRRFDFDVEAVVRLCWRGVRPVNLPAPVRYFRPEEAVFTLQLLARQRLADLDALSAILGIHRTPAAVVGATHASRGWLGSATPGNGPAEGRHRGRPCTVQPRVAAEVGTI